MRRTRVLPIVVGLGGFATGWGAGCVQAVDPSIDTATDAGVAPGMASAAPSASPAEMCPLCVTDADCAAGSVCAQFGADIYCAPACNGGACPTGRACATVSSYAGDQVDVCVPLGDVCGASVGPEPSGGGATAFRSKDAGAPPPSGTCGTLVGPDVPAQCHSCGTTHTCQANGCYNGWWCDTSTDRCQAPPTSCGTPPPPQDAGTPPPPQDAGAPPPPPPPPGTIGPSGGTEASLYFAIVGDTRPPTIDDTSGYPTAVITKIYRDLEAMSPRPPFVVTTGDYQFSTANGTQSGPQFDLYMSARAAYSGVQFPAMGNHECTGATASNCGAGNTNGITKNYENFLAKLLAPIGQQKPYYEIDVSATNGSWTAKFLFVAANAWDSAQASWLSTAMARPTTYTFIVRHEPKAATSPGTAASENIMAQHPYTLALVGHTHTYGHTAAKQITIGNGGAPLTGGATYGFGLITQRSDGTLQADVYDSTTMQPDPSFRFAVHPDGSPAP